MIHAMTPSKMQEDTTARQSDTQRSGDRCSDDRRF